MSKTEETPTKKKRQHSDFARELASYINAGFHSFTVQNQELARVEKEVRSVASALKTGFVTWDCVSGCSAEEGNDGLRNPLKMLEYIETIEGDAIIVMRNLDIFLNADPSVAQKYQVLCETSQLNCATHRRPIVISGAGLKIPKKLAHLPTPIDFRLPDYSARKEVFTLVQQSAAQRSKERGSCSDEHAHKIIEATAGLTRSETEDIITLALIRNSGFEGESEDGEERFPHFLNTIESEKAKTFRDTAAMDYYSKDQIATEDEIGGFDAFKAWVKRRMICFSQDAGRMHLDPPKGVVLLGVPGTGKSLVAKTTARILDMPLVKFDIGSVFGSLVGESEQRMRDALEKIDALEGCVLFVDEVDKAFGGANDAAGDSGVTRRVFGSFLTWLQEKKANTFVIMTMNRTAGLPPEFLRKGRFDEVFFVDLPTAEERERILKIHMVKRGIPEDSMTPEELDKLVGKMEKWCGAEIEDAVKEAKLIAAADRGENVPQVEDYMQAVADTKTLADLDPKGIEEIRTFCKDKARNVSGLGENAVKKRTPRRRGVHIEADS